MRHDNKFHNRDIRKSPIVYGNPFHDVLKMVVNFYHKLIEGRPAPGKVKEVIERHYGSCDK